MILEYSEFAWTTVWIVQCSLDIQMLSINKKIALHLDNCNTHSIEYQDQLTNVKIIFLSPKVVPENQTKSIEQTLTRCSMVRVYLRCVFLKIYNIDTVNEQYSADSFIQATWREPLLDNAVDVKKIDLEKFWNPKLSIENLFKETKDTTSLEVIYPDNNGVAYLVQKRRLKAIFHETLELMQFPFDCQDLSITVSTELSSDEVMLIENPNDPSKINSIDAMESQEWSVHSHVEVELKEWIDDCNIGPKSRLAITFTCRASRKFGYFLVNYFMISSMFYLLTFCSFAVKDNMSGRLQLCMTTLLTSVTFKVAASNNLPKVPYLTYLDLTVLGNIFNIMCLCIWHASVQKLDINSILNIEKILIPSVLSFYALAVIIFGLTIYFDAGSRRREMQSKDIKFEEKLKDISYSVLE